MRRPRILTFDCYGTLIDWNAGIVAAMSVEAERQGRAADAAAILTAYHAAEPRVQAGEYRTYREVLTLLETEIAARARLAAARNFRILARELAGVAPFSRYQPGPRSTALGGFRARHPVEYRRRPPGGVPATPDAEFDLIVTAQRVRSYKPAAPHFDSALRHVGGDRGAILHVAQSYFHDVRPADAHGIATLWVNRLREPLPHDGPAPTADVADFAAAADWVERTFRVRTGR